MQTSLNAIALAEYVSAQCNNYFPDGVALDRAHLLRSVDAALLRLEYCFTRVAIPRYVIDGQPQFSHLDSDQYLMFLWFLSNELCKGGAARSDASKIFVLNKALHAFNCLYDCPLPDIFLVIHGVGTVLGKATYQDYLYVFQGCTVGAHAGKYPVLGKGVALGVGAKVIGDCTIGSFASIGAGTVLVGQDVKARHSVFRNTSGVLVQRPAKPLAEQGFFTHFLHA